MNPLENLILNYSLDILGYTATIVVLISFLYEGRRMRFLNSIGALLWMVWGFLLSQPPVWVLNGIIVLIHIFKLRAKEEVNNDDGKENLEDGVERKGGKDGK
jgi:hypothetical protein